MANNNFGSWIIMGDEWIVSYLSCLPGVTFGTVERFSMAHAFELYFKACLVKKFDEETAMKSGHNLFAMYTTLKLDPDFLPGINIPQDVYDAYSVEVSSINTTPPDMQMRILKWQHLLLIFKYTADLKYWRFKKVKGEIGMGTSFPDDRYAHIFNQIRKYLNFDGDKSYDILKRFLEEDRHSLTWFWTLSTSKGSAYFRVLFFQFNSVFDIPLAHYLTMNITGVGLFQ